MSTRRDRKIQRLSGHVRISETVQIEEAHGGAFTVRALGRNVPYSEVGSAWLDSDNSEGDWARLGFVQNKSTLPIFFSRNSIPMAARKFLGAPPDPIPPVIYAWWYSELANFSRSNSWTSDEPFDFTNPVRQPIPVGGPFARFAESNRVIVDDTGRRLGVPYDSSDPSGSKVWWSYTGWSALEALGLSDGSYDEWYNGQYGEPEEEDERTHSIVAAQAESVCIVGELIYVEIFYVIETATENPEYSSSTEDERRILFAISTQPPAFPSSGPDTVWHLRTDSLSEAGRRYDSDIVVTGGRAVILCGPEWDPEIFHVDALTGQDFQSVALPEIDHNNSLSILAPCIDLRWQPIFAPVEGQSKILIGGNSTALMLIDLTSNSVIWSKSDIDKAWHPIGIIGSSVLCAYEEREYETITDYVYTLADGFTGGGSNPYGLHIRDWWDDPQHNPVPRAPVLARGHSSRAGIVALSLANGEEVGRTLFADTVPNGTVDGPRTDYFTTVSFPDWTSLPNPVNPADPSHCQPQHYNCPTFPSGCVPSVRDFFVGVLPDEEYQEENETGTYIEGPRIGDNSGEFQGWRNSLGTPGWDDSLWWWDDHMDDEVAAHATAWATGGDPETQPINPDNLGPIEAIMAGIEDSRQANGDWIRAEVDWIEYSSVGIFEEGIATAGPALGSETFSAISALFSTREAFNVIPSPTIRVGGGFKPTYPYPYYAASTIEADYEDNEYSVEFLDWLRAWTPPSGLEPPYPREDVPYPWNGTYASFQNLAGTSGGHAMKLRRKIVWRPKGESLERTRTATPNLTLGPTCNTGSLIVLGPRFVSGQGLRWQAYTATGALAWEQTINKLSAFPGIPIALSIPEDKIGVFTCYTYESQRWLCVLDGATGDVLYDEALPSTVGSGILQPYYGDGVIWAGNYSVGVAPGEEE